MGEDEKKRGASNGHEYPPEHGTFRGVANYPPPPPPHQQPAMGFPQPVPGFAVADGRPVREHRLPCGGIGIGWVLFIIGFFLGAIPWYVGAFILLCAKIDHREKPGYIACTVVAILATVFVVIVELTK